jgi:hypothetical protein
VISIISSIKSDWFEYNIVLCIGPNESTKYFIFNVTEGINSIPKGIMGLKFNIWILIPIQPEVFVVRSIVSFTSNFPTERCAVPIAFGA